MDNVVTAVLPISLFKPLLNKDQDRYPLHYLTIVLFFATFANLLCSLEDQWILVDTLLNKYLFGALKLDKDTGCHRAKSKSKQCRGPIEEESSVVGAVGETQGEGHHRVITIQYKYMYCTRNTYQCEFCLTKPSPRVAYGDQISSMPLSYCPDAQHTQYTLFQHTRSFPSNLAVHPLHRLLPHVQHLLTSVSLHP